MELSRLFSLTYFGNFASVICSRITRLLKPNQPAAGHRILEAHELLPNHKKPTAPSGSLPRAMMRPIVSAAETPSRSPVCSS